MKLSINGRCPVCNSRDILSICRYVGFHKEYDKHRFECSKCREDLFILNLLGLKIYLAKNA